MMVQQKHAELWNSKVFLPNNDYNYNSYYNSSNYNKKDYYYVNYNNYNVKHKFVVENTLFVVDTEYVPIKLIGAGSYGVVCSSINTRTGEEVAIKKITNVFANKVGALSALREMKILRYVQHDNVIELKDIMITSPQLNFKDIYLVFELMDTDLHNVIHSNQPLSEEHCRYFMLQILQGLNYLHSANVMHCDLKPGNLLVNADCNLKIGDFGLARTSKGKGQNLTDQYLVTRWYRAPELLLACKTYDKSIDIWSVGCIFAELLGRTPLFCGKNNLEQLRLILKVLGTQPDSELEFIPSESTKKFIKELPYGVVNFRHLFPEADPLAIDLLRRMLKFNPNNRITAAEALRHPYFSSMCGSRLNLSSPVPLNFDSLDNAGEEDIRNSMVTEMEILHFKS